jgi:uncharacterized membrane protein
LKRGFDRSARVRGGHPHISDGGIVENSEAPLVATFSVWQFDSAEAAGRCLHSIDRSAGVVDAALVSWPEGSATPATRQVEGLAAPSAGLGGGFWGFLFGLVFYVPLLGLSIGPVAGAHGVALRDAGLDDAFIKTIRKTVTPGTSALFLLSEDAVVAELAGPLARAALLRTSLPDDGEKTLREAFAVDVPSAA